MIYELPHQLNILDISEDLHNEISSSGMIPPVMLSYSLGSLISLKYLESHAASALILVNPIPLIRNHSELQKVLNISKDVIQLKLNNSMNDSNPNSINVSSTNPLYHALSPEVNPIETDIYINLERGESIECSLLKAVLGHIQNYDL
jgi:hypothetical protein